MFKRCPSLLLGSLLCASLLPATAMAQVEPKGFYATLYGQYSKIGSSSFTESGAVGAGNGLRAEFGGVPPHVVLYAAALGDRRGRIALTMPIVDGAPQEQWASTAKDYRAHLSARVETTRFEVEMVALDDLGLCDVTAIKLDAEGAEYEILRGARETLLRCRPVLSLEIEERHREGSTWAVPAYLDALGYDTLFELDGALRPVSAFDRATMQVASGDPSVFAASDPYVFVFYALPREGYDDMLRRLEATG